MNNRQINGSLKRALEQAPLPDVTTLINTPVIKMTEHDYITQQKKRWLPSRIPHYSLAVSFCLVFLLCFSGWWVQYRMPDSAIYLDVNPSIAIVTNRQGQILSLTALNSDAQSVVSGLDYKHTNLNGTLDMLINVMLSKGYLTSDKNVVLLSVENKNTEKASAQAAALDAAIQRSATSQHLSVTVLTQVFTKDDKLSDLAAKYHVSAGKIKLASKIQASAPALSMETLTAMSVKDLDALAEKRDTDTPENNQPGTEKNQTTLPTTSPSRQNSTSSSSDMSGNDSRSDTSDTTQNDNSSSVPKASNKKVDAIPSDGGNENSSVTTPENPRMNKNSSNSDVSQQENSAATSGEENKDTNVAVSDSSTNGDTAAPDTSNDNSAPASSDTSNESTDAPSSTSSDSRNSE